MGNSPLTVCISQAFEKQTVQVVLPDGQVLFMPHPLTVRMLMEAHPSHIVCHGSPSLLEQRLPVHYTLQSGEIYYLLPSSQPAVPTTPTRDLVQSIKQQQQHAKVTKQLFKQSRAGPYKPPSDFSDYARLSLKPQRYLINLFVFRQSVASIMPEESFKSAPQTKGPSEQFHHQLIGDKLRASPLRSKLNSTSTVALLNNRRNGPPQLDQSPKQQLKALRGRKQVGPWKPHLESISESRPVLHDFSSLPPTVVSTTYNKNSNKYANYINNFSVPMISGVKTLSTAPSPPDSPLNHLVLPLRNWSHGGHHHYQQQFNQQHEQAQWSGGLIHGVIHSPLSSPRAGDRDNHRQRHMYSA